VARQGVNGQAGSPPGTTWFVRYSLLACNVTPSTTLGRFERPHFSLHASVECGKIKKLTVIPVENGYNTVGNC